MRFPRLTRATVAVLFPVLAASLAACGDDSPAGSRATEGPTTLQTEAAPPTRDGFERVECDLEAGDRALSVALDVPAGATALDRPGEGPSHSCVYVPRTEGSLEIRVVLLDQDPESNEDLDIASLADVEAGFDERYGEEAVDDVVWEQDVVVFGQTVGNRLSWTAEYEGIPEWDFRAEAEDVQVWLTAQGESFDGTEVEETFEQIIASVRRS